MSIETPQFWVGTYYEKTLVYDPSTQNDSHTFVLLWDVDAEVMYRYAVDFARKRLRSIRDSVCKQAAVDRYRASLPDENTKLKLKKTLWELAPLYGMIPQVPGEVEFEQTLEERHKSRLIALGFPYKGTRTSRKRKLRVAHCWVCLGRLDNSVDLECVACGWLLCDCGTCGCGYVRGNHGQRSLQGLPNFSW